MIVYFLINNTLKLKKKKINFYSSEIKIKKLCDLC